MEEKLMLQVGLDWMKFMELLWKLQVGFAKHWDQLAPEGLRSALGLIPRRVTRAGPIHSIDGAFH